jgi:hypothetical protein
LWTGRGVGLGRTAVTASQAVPNGDPESERTKEPHGGTHRGWRKNRNWSPVATVFVYKSERVTERVRIRGEVESIKHMRTDGEWRL